MVIEVMGRHSGWIALYAGLAGGADMILIPEQKYTIQEIVSTIRKRHERGKDFSIVVVAEGAQISAEGKEKEYVVSEGGLDEFGHVKLGGIGQLVANAVEEATSYETRVTVLGHLQRGGDAYGLRPRLGHALWHCRHRLGARRRFRQDGESARQ